MSIIGSILTLERAIPDGVLTGLLSGQYSLHGGVIRNGAGQIVRHLVPTTTSLLDPFGFLNAVPSLFNVYQLHKLTKMTEQLIAMSTATMAMSGLNLAISVVGFAALQTSLRRVDKRLTELDAKTVWIKKFLDSGRRARLLHAIEQLSTLPSVEAHRAHILHASRDALGEVAMHYLQHWDESTNLWEAMSYQHYYCTAFLAQARCSAELEMQDLAINEFQRGMTNWQIRSRRIMTKQIFKDERSRFLGKEYLRLAPAAKIAGWMDFAYKKGRGYRWIDELRAEYSPPWIRFSVDKEEIKKEVYFLDNLVSRDNVLKGYESQLKFFAERKIRPSTFEEELTALASGREAEKMLILATDDLPPANMLQPPKAKVPHGEGGAEGASGGLAG